MSYLTSKKLHGYVLKVKTNSSQSTTNSDSSSRNKAGEENVTCASVNYNFEAEAISMYVVPIKISYQNCRKTMRSYAMLDNCSQESFIKQDLLKRVGVNGQKLSLNLKALTGEMNKMNKMNNDWISLPKVYSKKTLPVEKEPIVTPEKVSKWKYLDSIKSEITQKDDIEIGMLIGANCVKALEPLKIIPSKNGGPHASQTKLGWCIVGPIWNVGHQNSLTCNRVTVNDASNGKLSKHHFLIENESKDVSIE